MWKEITPETKIELNTKVKLNSSNDMLIVKKQYDNKFELWRIDSSGKVLSTPETLGVNFVADKNELIRNYKVFEEIN